MSDAKGPIKIHTRFAPQHAKTPPMHTLPPTHHTPNRSRSTIALNGPSGARTRFDLRQPTTTAAATHTHKLGHTQTPSQTITLTRVGPLFEAPLAHLPAHASIVAKLALEVPQLVPERC